MVNVTAAEGDSESTKQKPGGRRTGIRYMKDTMFAVQTNLPAKRHKVRKGLVHLFPKLKSREREALH